MGAPAIDVTPGAQDAPLHDVFGLAALLRDISHLETLTMQSLTLTEAAMLAAALMTGCDHAADSMDPASGTPNTPAFAAGAVDPNTLVPAPPEGAVCRADGQWTICHTSLSFAPVNELSGDVLPCGPVYQTGTDERRGIRWYNSDGLLAKRFVTQDVEFTWSLSPTGAGPLITLSAHANWRNVYAVPGSDADTEPQFTHGNEVTISQPGVGVIAHIAGLDGKGDTHRGVFRLFDDPAVAATLCAALTP
jgi:hypothetical protein